MVREVDAFRAPCGGRRGRRRPAPGDHPGRGRPSASADAAHAERVGDKYTTLCDPRLNPAQAMSVLARAGAAEEPTHPCGGTNVEDRSGHRRRRRHRRRGGPHAGRCRRLGRRARPGRGPAAAGPPRWPPRGCGVPAFPADVTPPPRWSGRRPRWSASSARSTTWSTLPACCGPRRGARSATRTGPPPSRSTPPASSRCRRRGGQPDGHRRGRGAIVTVASNAAGTPRNGHGRLRRVEGRGDDVHQVPRSGAGRPRHPLQPGRPGLDRHPNAALHVARTTPARRATIAGRPDAYKVGIPLGKLAQPSRTSPTPWCSCCRTAPAHITMHDLTVDGGAAALVS